MKTITDERRDALEANWKWSPRRGDIPFTRPRITDRNIDDQRKHARAGKLIHWTGGLCWRRARKMDVVVDGAITHMAVASHIENVNCLRCRKNYFAALREQRGGA